MRTIYLFPKMQYANSVLCATFLHKTLPLSEWMLLHSISYAYLANSLSFGTIKMYSISQHIPAQCVRSATHTKSAVFKAVEMFPSKPGRKRCQYLIWCLKDVVSAMQPCIWELWLLSLRLFANLAACCCADVLFDSTCFSARCCCTQEDRQASVAGWTLYSSERCRCSPWCISVCGDGLAPGTERLQKLPSVWLQSRRMTPDGLYFFLLLFSSFSRPLSFLSVADKCAKETKTQRKSIRPISWQKPFHFFDSASSFVLSLGVGSRDTMGGKAIKGLLLEWSLLYS